MRPDRALIDKHIGAQIARRRWELNINVGCVAESLQVEPRTIVRWEAGAERTPPEALFHLARLFDCSLTYFFETPLARGHVRHGFHLRVVGGKATELGAIPGTARVGNNELGANDLERAGTGLSRAVP